MRSVRLLVIAGLGMGLAASWAKAEDPKGEARATRAPDVEKAPDKPIGVSIRYASDEPTAGYEKMEVTGEVVYVAPGSAFSTTDLMSITEGGSRVALKFNNDMAAQVAANVGSRLAIFVDGHLTSAPIVTYSTETGVMELSGLLPGQAQRVARVLTAMPATPSGPTLTVVPRELTVPPGGTATADVFLSGVVELRAYQVALDVTGGQKGRLDLGEITVDILHPNYVFKGHQSVNAADPNRIRALSALFDGAVPVQEAAYVATFSYTVSDDASGKFQLQVRVNSDTLLRDANGLPIGFQTAEPGTITIGRTLRPIERE